MIPDAKSPAVNLRSFAIEAPDLTYSDLRSVSPVHIKYLDHMGVEATFSIPIKLGGELWGLVACHNLVPKKIDFEQRKMCVRLAKAYGMGVFTYSSGRKLQSIDRIDRQVSALMKTLVQSSNLFSGIKKNQDIFLMLMKADGFVAFFNDEIITMGKVPDDPQVLKVDKWFKQLFPESTLYTDHLVDYFPDEKFSHHMSGMFAIKIEPKHESSIRMFWFRTELPQTVNWGGNPDKPMMENDGVAVLSPRRSFEKWTQTKTGYSLSWGFEEKTIAAKIRSSIFLWF